MEKYQKTNFYSMVAEGGLYQICNKFWDPSTIVPLFILTYAGNMTVVGLSSTLARCIGVLLTLILGMIFWRIKNLARFQFNIMLLRGLPLPMVILIALSTIAGFCPMTFFYNQNYMVDITSNENRAAYLIMNTVLLFPLSFVSLIYGIIADYFGFLPVLSIGGIATLVCLFIAKGLLSPDKIPVWQEELKKHLHKSGEINFVLLLFLMLLFNKH